MTGNRNCSSFRSQRMGVLPVVTSCSIEHPALFLDRLNDIPYLHLRGANHRSPRACHNPLVRGRPRTGIVGRGSSIFVIPNSPTLRGDK